MRIGLLFSLSVGANSLIPLAVCLLLTFCLSFELFFMFTVGVVITIHYYPYHYLNLIISTSFIQAYSQFTILNNVS